MITAVRCKIHERNISEHYYPFGNTRIRNVLKDFNCKISGDSTEATKVLFLGCGDLRNAFQATTAKHLQVLDIHVNDVHPAVLARNIIILKIISAPDFNPNDIEDISFLWDVWYNMDWPEVTRKRFLSVIKDLLDNKLPDEVVIPKRTDIGMFMALWETWQSVSSTTVFESEILLKKVQKQRKELLLSPSCNSNPEDLAETKAVALKKLVEGLKVGSVDLENSVWETIHEEARSCFNKGSCRLQKDVSIVCVNPTLLDSTTLNWGPTLCRSLPFDGYLPLTEEELNTSHENGILLRSCQKILKTLVHSYRSRAGFIKMFFHLGDALEFCYTDTNKFDVIDSTIFVEGTGLGNLIMACSQRMSDKPGSMFSTEIVTDSFECASAVKELIEKSLCAPLSLIPTIYGLRLVNHVELGDASHHLCWQKVAPFQNITMGSSPVIKKCLEKLAEKCYCVSFPYHEDMEEAEGWELLVYTPLTLVYVCSSMFHRLGNGPWLQDVFNLKHSFCFDLTKRTLTDWMQGKKITKYLSRVKLNPLDKTAAHTKLTGANMLRLILLPKTFVSEFLNKMKKGWVDVSTPLVHFIDNFQLQVNRPAIGIKEICVSFFLIPNHGLKKTHTAIVVDPQFLRHYFTLGSMESMQEEELNLPYPFEISKAQLPSSNTQMKVLSCIETEDQYALDIELEVGSDISTLLVDPSENPPCESFHEITLSLINPSRKEPLKLFFPFPVILMEEPHAVVREYRYLDLVLKKAMFEPWPIDFSGRCKMDVRNWKPWVEKSVERSSTALPVKSLKRHLDSQFPSCWCDIHPSLPYDSALSRVRRLIRELYSSPKEFVSVGFNQQWYHLRLHRPIVTSPDGQPILLVSAYDDMVVDQAVTSLMSMDPTEAGLGYIAGLVKGSFLRVFPDSYIKHVGKKGFSFSVGSEEFQLFRLLLRLNSNIEPNTWQKNNIPMVPFSPWIITFLSPLYLTDPPLARYFGDHASSCGFPCDEPHADDRKCCAACKKTSENLKVCARCRSASYCNADCQRADWPKHKAVCKSL